MSTVVVRKKDGSLVEFSWDGNLSFSYQRDRVNIWHKESGRPVAEVEGTEAWQKEALVPPPATDYTGYYLFTGEGNKNEICSVVDTFLCPDGQMRFNLYAHGDNRSGNVYRSHKEWLARGFVPVKKVK